MARDGGMNHLPRGRGSRHKSHASLGLVWPLQPGVETGRRERVVVITASSVQPHYVTVLLFLHLSPPPSVLNHPPSFLPFLSLFLPSHPSPFLQPSFYFSPPSPHFHLSLPSAVPGCKEAKEAPGTRAMKSRGIQEDPVM